MHGPCLRVLKGHEEAVTSLAAFAGPDGSVVAPIIFSGSKDCEIKVWALQDGECIQTLSGHRDAVLGLAVLAASASASVLVTGCVDGTAGVLASGCEDGTVKAWRILRITNPV